MKYVLMFGETAQQPGQSESMPDYERIMKWFDKHGGKIHGGYELQPKRAATTVRFDTGRPSVTDGPFIEGKESIAGYAEIDVPDLDEAIAMAKEWPTGGPVEIRPVIDRGEPER